MSDNTKALLTAKKNGLAEVINYYFQNKTPKEFIKTRPGAGGQSFRYVTVGYVLSQLNIAFGFNWEWRVIEQQVGNDQIWLRGELTIKDFTTGNSVTRSGVGGAIIKKSTRNGEPISVANDLKSADSDALKVAAAKFGIGADVKFKEMEILEDLPDVVDVEKGEGESIRQIVQKKYFAICSERGFNGESAKEKIKTVFKVEHMEQLTTAQIEAAIKAMESKYQVVATGEEPLAMGEFRKNPVVENIVEVQAVEESIFDDVVKIDEIDNKPPLCAYDKCTKGEDGKKAIRLDPSSVFCSVECKANYSS